MSRDDEHARHDAETPETADARIRAMQAHVNNDTQPPGWEKHEREWADWADRGPDWHREQTELSPDAAAAAEEKRAQRDIVGALHHARPSTERTWARPGEHAVPPMLTNREQRERFGQPVPGDYPGRRRQQEQQLEAG